MKKFLKFDLLIIWPVIVFISFSCSNSIDPNIDIAFENITYSELTSSIDTSTFYYKYYEDWEYPFDSSKVNALVTYYVHSYFPVNKMWVPNCRSSCEWALSDNFVFINLTNPVSSLIKEGYKKCNRGFISCWDEFRYYKIH
ncbi:MAG: hypothetical protein PVH88_10550 [Ignavibacteria bacterium]|jgi:hypothetical protein